MSSHVITFMTSGFVVGDLKCTFSVTICASKVQKNQLLWGVHAFHLLAVKQCKTANSQSQLFLWRLLISLCFLGPFISVSLIFLYLFLLFLSCIFRPLIFPHIILQSLWASVTSFYFRKDSTGRSSLLRKLCSGFSSTWHRSLETRYSLHWHFWQSNVQWGVGRVEVMNGNAGFLLKEFFHQVISSV